MTVILKINWNSCVVMKHQIEWTCLLSDHALKMNYTLVKNKKKQHVTYLVNQITFQITNSKTKIRRPLNNKGKSKFSRELNTRRNAIE